VNRSFHWELTRLARQNQFSHLPWKVLNKQEAGSCALEGRHFLSRGFSQNPQRTCRDGEDGSQGRPKTNCGLSLLSYTLSPESGKRKAGSLNPV
jgi:hypothetical protein